MLRPHCTPLNRRRTVRARTLPVPQYPHPSRAAGSFYGQSLPKTARRQCAHDGRSGSTAPFPKADMSSRRGTTLAVWLWSLTILHERLAKTGAKVIRHGPAFTFSTHRGDDLARLVQAHPGCHRRTSTAAADPMLRRFHDRSAGLSTKDMLPYSGPEGGIDAQMASFNSTKTFSGRRRSL